MQWNQRKHWFISGQLLISKFDQVKLIYLQLNILMKSA